MNTRNSCVIMAFAGLSSLALLSAQVAQTIVAPDSSFTVLGSVGAGGKLREFKADGSGVWAVVQAPSGSVSITRTALTGEAISTVAVPGAIRVSGLAATTDGVAALLIKDKKPVLAHYNRSANLISETPLGCAMIDGLLTIDGGASTLCPDGSLVLHPLGGAPKESFSSWARPGSLAEMLASKRLAIVDQVTGRIIFNDIVSGEATPGGVPAPEIQDALNKYRTARASAVRKPSDPPIGKELVVMDTATDGQAVYLLIWPYNRLIGPSVVAYAADGGLKARLVCKTGPEAAGAPLHKIEVTGGYLLLGSTSGAVLRFKL